LIEGTTPLWCADLRAVLSNLVLSEAFTLELLAGSALILGSVGIAAWPGRRR
jgi:drug/metabolite transporter (DMT)-like permease